MRTATFEHNGATVTMHERLGEDDMVIPGIALMIARYIAPDVDPEKLPEWSWNQCLYFGGIVRQTASVEGDLGLTVPGAHSEKEELQRFYDALFRDPNQRELLQKFRGTLVRLSNPPADDLHQNAANPEQSSAVRKPRRKSKKPSGGA